MQHGLRPWCKGLCGVQVVKPMLRFVWVICNGIHRCLHGWLAPT